MALAGLAAPTAAPYVVDGLHRLPLREVAGGAHDPKDLWPQCLVAGLVQLAGVFAACSTPVVLGVVGLVAGAALLPARPMTLAAEQR